MKIFRRVALAIIVGFTWLSANAAFRGEVLPGSIGVLVGFLAVFAVCWIKRTETIPATFFINGTALLSLAYMLAVWTPRLVPGDETRLWAMVTGAGFLTFGLACWVAAALGRAMQK